MRVYKENAPLTPQQNEELLEMLPKGTDPERVLFWDIETTGFSRKYDSIYLMGYFYWEGRRPMIEQHLAASTADELALLESFLQKMDDYELLVTFNGDAFDIPFVRERLRTMRIPGELHPFSSLDLYKLYRPYAPFFRWDSCKLKALERFLGIDREDRMDGGELIEVFYEYSRTEDKRLEKALLLHNYEDILNLPILLRIQKYVDYLKQETVHSLSLSPDGPEVRLSFAMDQTAPLSISTQYFVHKKSVPIRLETDRDDSHILFRIPVYTGTLRYYLPNYKEYYVLPSGELLHKSLDTPPFRRTATREEGCIAKAGDFIAIAQVDLPQGLHPFRAECRDKNLYVELSELTRWSQSASEQSLSALLRCLLPFG